MRLRQRDLKTVYIKKSVSKQDDDGTTYNSYEEIYTEIKASIQPAGGKVLAEMYGQRLAYMKTMRYEGDVNIREGDGICIEALPTESPDYKVMAINPWGIKVYDLEKV